MVTKDDVMHSFSEVHIREADPQKPAEYDNALFHGCTFHDLNGLTLKNCTLADSVVAPRNLREALGFTITLNCASFKDVRFSEMWFDLLCMLLTLTAGNDEKKKIIREQLLGELKYEVLSRLFRAIE